MKDRCHDSRTIQSSTKRGTRGEWEKAYQSLNSRSLVSDGCNRFTTQSQPQNQRARLSASQPSPACIYFITSALQHYVCCQSLFQSCKQVQALLMGRWAPSILHALRPSYLMPSTMII